MVVLRSQSVSPVALSKRKNQCMGKMKGKTQKKKAKKEKQRSQQTVGLSRARRLAQGKSIKIQLFASFPVQIDGEPWLQQPCTLAISHHGQAFMLKRTAEEPLGHAVSIINDVLENAETNRVITASQKRALLQEMALRLT